MKLLEISPILITLVNMKKKTWIDPIPTLVALALAASAGLIFMLLIGVSDTFNALAELFLWLPIFLAPTIVSLIVFTVLRPIINADPTRFYAIASAIFVIAMVAGMFLLPEVPTATYLVNIAVFCVMAAITVLTVKKQR